MQPKRVQKDPPPFPFSAACFNLSAARPLARWLARSQRHLSAVAAAQFVCPVAPDYMTEQPEEPGEDDAAEGCGEGITILAMKTFSLPYMTPAPHCAVYVVCRARTRRGYLPT